MRSYDVGIARAGVFPATAVACGRRCDLYPVVELVGLGPGDWR